MQASDPSWREKTGGETDVPCSACGPIQGATRVGRAGDGVPHGADIIDGSPYEPGETPTGALIALAVRLTSLHLHFPELVTCFSKLTLRAKRSKTQQL